ncbi:MAG TPA: tyrosine-type recombinase/integrase [Steroidobacteraceae bacterium]|nr:tyrosine-type recombinase/integrase [Steroidobacteraceae bacterium]
MMWSYWMSLYLRTHCVARGLRPLTIAAYEATLRQFQQWIEARTPGGSPDQVTPREVLEYLEHLRRDRDNGASAVNRTVTVLRNFYRAVIAMGHLEPRNNPLAGFPKIKAPARKLPVVLEEEEVVRLLATPRATTVIGVRDRAILALFYGTGIRVSECAGLREDRVDHRGRTITVRGKGGDERTVPFNEEVATRLREYVQVRGAQVPAAPFFRARSGRALARGSIYERVRTLGRRAHLAKRLSPHRLRHTCATHLLRTGAGLEVIRDILGHRMITSTQIYIHVTAKDLRAAAERHPISRLLGTIEHLLPNIRLPFQRPGARCAAG